MELHNALKSLSRINLKKSYLLDIKEDKDKLKIQSMVDLSKRFLTTCTDAEKIICDYWITVLPACNDVVSKTCPYTITGLSTGYNLTTEILSGSIPITGNVSSSTKLYVVKNGIKTLLSFTNILDGSGRHLDFNIPLALLSWLSDSYSIYLILESDECYKVLNFIRQEPLEIKQDLTFPIRKGLLPIEERFNNNYYIDVPYTIINPENEEWEIKNSSFTVNSVPVTGTIQIMDSIFSGEPVKFLRITIVRSILELVPTLGVTTFNIDFGYTQNPTIMSNITGTIDISDTDIFIGYL